MGGWMETARANARAMDQAMKQNPYRERLRQAGEYARKNGLAPQSVQTASTAIKPTETKIADPMAGLRSRESNQYLLSDDLKSAGEQMKSGLNAKLVTDGEFANTAVKNLRANGQIEAADNLKSQLDALERQRHIAELRRKRDSAVLQNNGQTVKQGTAAQTIVHTLNEGAGLFNQAVFSTADFVANAIPRIEGFVFNEDPEATFTGQVLKPLTYATGWLTDWAKKDTAASHQIVQANTANNKVANAIVSFAPNVIAALPNAVLAFMSGGVSMGGQLAAQSTGVSGTITAAASKMLHNPMTAVSFAQMLGPGYDQAKDRGANDVEAMTAATISALFNTIVEVSGGIEALPMEIRNVDLSNAQKAWRWVTSALGEGNEEVVQGIVSEMVNKAVFEENKPMFSMENETAVINTDRMAKEFGGGTAIGGILGGGQILTDNINTVLANKKNGSVVADTSLFDGSILSNLNKARTYLINYARDNFPASVENLQTGKTIGISRKGLDKFLSGRISYDKYATGFHIPELIANAYLVDQANNYHEDQVSNAPTYEYYDSPIQVNGQDYIAHIRVKNSVMGDKYYGHTISMIDEIKIESSARTSVPNESAVQPVHAIDDSTKNILDILGEVKYMDMVDFDETMIDRLFIEGLENDLD